MIFDLSYNAISVSEPGFSGDILNVNFRQSSSSSSMSSGNEAVTLSTYELQEDRKRASREGESVGFCHG